MDMLPGSSYAWHLRESSNEPSCRWFVTQGMVCGFFAHRQLAKSRQPETNRPLARRSVEQVPGS